MLDFNTALKYQFDPHTYALSSSQHQMSTWLGATWTEPEKSSLLLFFNVSSLLLLFLLFHNVEMWHYSRWVQGLLVFPVSTTNKHSPVSLNL